jgi:formylglycine-generating enzyme
MVIKWALLACVVLAAACGGGAGARDAGGGDAAPPADGAPDAAVPDDAAPTPDGPGDDAAPQTDALPDVKTTDAASCTVSGVPGTCLDVAECYGTRHPTAGLCPGPTEIQCCTPRYAVDCDPNALPEPNAGLTEETGEGSCLPGMIPVATFCIDRFEAALVEILGDGSTVPWSPYFNPAGHRVRAVSLRSAVPQGYLNETEAAAACAEAGKRMCTNTEWLRACQGPSGTTYPYGNTREPGVCNDARSVHPAVELYGTADTWIYSHIDSPCLNQLADGLALTGSHGSCITAEGAYDMMGNLHEWTSDPAGTFRGGFYVDTVVNGPGCLYATTAHDVSHWDYSTGFRCCADP